MTSTKTLDRAAIQRAIPHRDPFLFLDAILEVSDDALVSEWRVPEGAEFFRGHYPGNPVTPGVILCEHVFQSAAILLAERGVSFDPKDGVPVLARIEKAKFRRMVRPCERVRTNVRVAEIVGPAYYIEGRAHVDDALALELRFALTHGGRPRK